MQYTHTQTHTDIGHVYLCVYLQPLIQLNHHAKDSITPPAKWFPPKSLSFLKPVPVFIMGWNPQKVGRAHVYAWHLMDAETHYRNQTGDKALQPMFVSTRQLTKKSQIYSVRLWVCTSPTTDRAECCLLFFLFVCFCFCFFNKRTNTLEKSITIVWLIYS